MVRPRKVPFFPPLAVTPLTPPRPGGIAALLVWGSEAGNFLRRLFPGLEPGGIVFRRLKDAGGRIVDEVLALSVPADRSLTGREEGEITFHGGRAAHEAVIEFMMRRGARRVPFEDCLSRSVRYDEVQKEAFLHLAEARTRRQAAFLLRQLGGELSRLVREAMDEEDVRAAKRKIESLLARSRLGSALARPSRVLVVGPPNAGKSTLVNRLCGRERSIVTEVPGTTRDLLEAPADLDGLPVVVVDSCGLTEEGGELEKLGRDRVFREIEVADVVLCLGVSPESLPRAPENAIRLGPKADLGGDFGPGVLPVSGLTGRGIEALKRELRRILGGGAEGPGPAPFTPRQIGLLKKAARALEQARGDEFRSLLTALLTGKKRD